MRNSCKGCGYYYLLHRTDGSVRCYCDEKDCTVDPSDPECNYDN